MKDLEKRVQEVVFDVEVQYCDPSDCYHDCYGEGVNLSLIHISEPTRPY